MAYHHFRLFHVPLDTVHLCNYTEFPSAWWLSHPHKKYEFVRLDHHPNSWGKFQKCIKAMFQTSNQPWFFHGSVLNVQVHGDISPSFPPHPWTRPVFPGDDLWRNCRARAWNDAKKGISIGALRLGGSYKNI